MRLPDFLTKIPFIGKTLEAIGVGIDLLAEEVARRNRQLSDRTADTGLSLWEQDYGLPSGGDDAARHTRVRTVRTGGQTLTVHRKAVEGGWLFTVEHSDGKQAALAQLLVQPE